MATKTSESECVDLDTVLAQMGTFGRYQMTTVLLLIIPAMLSSIYNTQFVFAAAEVDYRCKIEDCDKPQASFNETWLEYALPVNRTRRCFRHPSRPDIDTPESCGPGGFDNISLTSCSQWVFKDEDTFVAELELACQDWKRTSVGTVHSIGALVSLLYTGHLSDWLGRKTVIWITGAFTALIGTIKSFSNSYIMYICFEFLESVVNGGLYLTVFVYGIEFTTKDRRLLFTSTLTNVYALGGVMYAFIAWKIPYWRDHIRAIYAPAILVCLYFFVLDESVRWLLSKGKKDSAVEILQKIAKVNKVDISKDRLENLKYEDTAKTKESPFLVTIKSKVMLLRFAISCFWWATSLLVYYGLTISSVSLGGDKYWNFALSSLVEIPADIACIFFLDYFGRRRCLLVSFASGGVLCVAMALVPPTPQWLTTTIFLLGKMTVNFTICILYFYTSELFPTYTRNTMQAACTSVGKIGAILAPQLPLLSAISPSIPPTIYACCSILSATLTLFTPDTRLTGLPDTVQQAERIEQRAYHANISPELVE